MVDQESYYVGTDLKFKVTITASGFSMTRDDYEIKVVCGSKTQVITKDDVVEDQSGNHYIMVDTSQFGSGLVKLVVIVIVPDDDFDKGRKEVAVQELCYLKKT